MVRRWARVITVVMGSMIPLLSVQAETVRIAVVAPLSGPHGAMGIAIHAAARMAVNDLNSAASMPGLSFEIVSTSDPCASRGAIAAANEVIGLKPRVIIGHPCSASLLAALPSYALAGQLVIAAAPINGVRAPAMTYRLGPGSETSGTVLADRLSISNGSARRIAVVRDKTAQAIALAAEIEASLKARGASVATTEVISGGDMDFRALARRLAQNNVTHVAIAAWPVEAALMIRDLVALLPTVEISVSDMSYSAEMVTMAGANLANVIFVLPAKAVAETARHGRAAVFAARLMAAGLDGTHAATLHAVAAIEVYAEAVRRAGTATPAPVAAQLTDQAIFSTLIGPVQFVGGRAQRPAWAIYRRVNGTLQEVP